MNLCAQRMLAMKKANAQIEITWHFPHILSIGKLQTPKIKTKLKATSYHKQSRVIRFTIMILNYFLNGNSRLNLLL